MRLRAFLLAVAGAAFIVGGFVLLDGSGSDGAGPVVAHPDRAWPVGSAAMRQAQSIAESVWHQAPCQGQVAIAWGDLPPRINAVSRWRNPIALYGHAALNRDCAIRLNRRAPLSWPKLCTVIVHEYGHLTGHHHSPDRRNVMSPIYSGALPRCRQAAAREPGL